MTQEEFDRLLRDGAPVAPANYARTSWSDIHKARAKHPEGRCREFEKLQEQYRRSHQ